MRQGILPEDDIAAMKISVIVTLYKNLPALSVVLEALGNQTDRDFDVIVAEDDDARESKDYLSGIKGLPIRHISQPDCGRNKLVIQNKAIAAAAGEYLIFLDGDTVPFRHYVEYTRKISRRGRVLSGRRVNLNPMDTARILSGELTTQRLESHYWWHVVKNFRDREARVEQGIQLDPSGWFYRRIMARRNSHADILGCNFSCYREDIIAINGFDEGYGDSIIGQEDTDLSWRFRAAGFELLSAKYIANCFHLYHSVNTKRNPEQDTIDMRRMKENRELGRYVCEKGISQYL